MLFTQCKKAPPQQHLAIEAGGDSVNDHKGTIEAQQRYWYGLLSAPRGKHSAMQREIAGNFHDVLNDAVAAEGPFPAEYYRRLALGRTALSILVRHIVIGGPVEGARRVRVATSAIDTAINPFGLPEPVRLHIAPERLSALFPLSEEAKAWYWSRPSEESPSIYVRYSNDAIASAAAPRIMEEQGVLHESLLAMVTLFPYLPSLQATPPELKP